jgi:hypothetical protein
MVYSFVIGLILFGIGTIFLIISIRGERRLRVYEFNNRSDGGVVQFPNYEASERHERKHMWLGLLAKISIWPILAGVLLMIIPVVSYFIDRYS